MFETATSVISINNNIKDKSNLAKAESLTPRLYSLGGSIGLTV